jgi:hypothetical protein
MLAFLGRNMGKSWRIQEPDAGDGIPDREQLSFAERSL